MLARAGITLASMECGPIAPAPRPRPRPPTVALRASSVVWEDFTYVANTRDQRERVVVDARRRCLVCDWEEQVTEPEDTDVLGPPCSRCHAPTERLSTAG